jgi:DNA (cytosine-5)-methyltransferase 1
VNYYNENDPKAAAWLRELIKAGLIAPGDVDERSITEVRASELVHYSQCHFFAGIGGWSYALRLAGWPDDRPVWTGSCPCQPFSDAGKGLAEKDPRHLWPVWRELIREGQPAVCFGEQVASAKGRKWLSGVFADLEAMGYRRAGADLCAAGVAAPHRRQRLFWVAYAHGARFTHFEGRPRSTYEAWRKISPSHAFNGGVHRRVPAPGFCPVVNGVSAMPFAVFGYGNAIVPQVAAEFIEACEEARCVDN